MDRFDRFLRHDHFDPDFAEPVLQRLAARLQQIPTIPSELGSVSGLTELIPDRLQVGIARDRPN